MKQKQKIIILISILVLLIVFFTATYAWLRYQIDGTKINVLKVGTLKIELNDELSDGILLQKAIPMSYQQGIQTKKYEFSVTNNGKSSIDYEIYLDDLELAHGINRISDEFIRYLLVKNDGEKLSSNSKILSDLYIPRQIEKTTIIGKTENESPIDKYELYVWIDSKAELKDINDLDENLNVIKGKEFSVKLRIEATQSHNNVINLKSSQVEYSNENSKTEVATIEEALNELYEILE